MKNFFVVANQTKVEAVNLVASVKSYLETHGATCQVGDGDTDKDRISDDTECVIVLGGDGTLLRIANELEDKEVAFLGINLGTLGYLSAASKEDTYIALDRMLKDDYVIEKRLMLSGIINADEDSRMNVLNEIVISGDKALQIVYVSVYINGQFMHKYEADGVIIATPTGSTAYSLSAGGPIINPTAQTMVLTPISPHSMHNRSTVFSSDDEIRIDIEVGRYGSQSVVAVFDGQKRQTLTTGDSITINKSTKSTKIVKLTEESFLETLHNKLEG